MAPQQTTRRRVTDERTDAGAALSPSREAVADEVESDDVDSDVGVDDPRTLNSEDVHVRSYAHETTYELDLEVRAPDGDVAFETTYALEPGALRSEINALPTGAYEVRATLGDERSRTLRCLIDDSPDGTVLVEVGNGVLSLTEGLHDR
ncbi:hypothetical protein [Halobellus sp. EA9]|uniref:hypothetical protein n=1 Tax=Halobellus sp. EA9 TaxID=3421647 RepID=UPI003EB92A2D